MKQDQEQNFLPYFKSFDANVWHSEQRLAPIMLANPPFASAPLDLKR